MGRAGGLAHVRSVWRRIVMAKTTEAKHKTRIYWKDYLYIAPAVLFIGIFFYHLDFLYLSLELFRVGWILDDDIQRDQQLCQSVSRSQFSHIGLKYPDLGRLFHGYLSASASAVRNYDNQKLCTDPFQKCILFSHSALGDGGRHDYGNSALHLWASPDF